MERILVKDKYVNINFESQSFSLGREFRLSGIKLDLSKPVTWINKIPFHSTIYTFRYFDDGSFFGLYVDAYGVFSHKLTHQQVLKQATQ
jgi:hypothetical protein